MSSEDVAPAVSEEPIKRIEVNGAQLTLLGTAHVSRASAATVDQLLDTEQFDAVAVELCQNRYQAIVNPDALAQMDLFQVIRSGKVPMVTASLALGAFQQRLAEQFGIEPGAEMRAAVNSARRKAVPLLLIDRDIGVTLKRTYRRVSWWRRLYLFSGLVAGVLSREEVSEEEIERLKAGDILEATFAEFADTAGDIYEPIITERDRYMAAKLRQAIQERGLQCPLAIVGAGHLTGVCEHLAGEAQPPAGVIAELERVPPANSWVKAVPWLIVALILAGFFLGFSRSESLGWAMVRDWVLINGGLSALGALLAAAHPLTVLTAFAAAPLTSLNPTIGAGMVTAAVELFMRKPTVGDFNRLRSDVTGIYGWRHNRVARTLLIFVLSTLGSAVGTYVAGARILERLI